MICRKDFSTCGPRTARPVLSVRRIAAPMLAGGNVAYAICGNTIPATQKPSRAINDNGICGSLGEPTVARSPAKRDIFLARGAPFSPAIITVVLDADRAGGWSSIIRMAVAVARAIPITIWRISRRYAVVATCLNMASATIASGRYPASAVIRLMKRIHILFPEEGHDTVGNVARSVCAYIAPKERDKDASMRLYYFQYSRTQGC